MPSGAGEGRGGRRKTLVAKKAPCSTYERKRRTTSQSTWDGKKEGQILRSIKGLVRKKKRKGQPSITIRKGTKGAFHQHRERKKKEFKKGCSPKVNKKKRNHAVDQPRTEGGKGGDLPWEKEKKKLVIRFGPSTPWRKKTTKKKRGKRDSHSERKSYGAENSRRKKTKNTKKKPGRGGEETPSEALINNMHVGQEKKTAGF